MQHIDIYTVIYSCLQVIIPIIFCGFCVGGVVLYIHFIRPTLKIVFTDLKIKASECKVKYYKQRMKEKDFKTQYRSYQAPKIIQKYNDWLNDNGLESDS